MALMKCTIKIKLATNTTDVDSPTKRIAGWSESFYGNDLVQNFRPGPFSPVTPLAVLCVRRAAMLPRSASIYGQRVQQIDPVGQSQSYSEVFPGSAGLACDLPQVALIGRAKGAGVLNSREVNFRGLPDARAIEGEYKPADAFETALDRFFAFIAILRFKARDLAQVATPIITILGNGTFETEGACGLLGGDMVRLLRVVDSNNNRTGGRFKVDHMISATSGVLYGYDLGVRKDGKIRKDVTIYPNFDGNRPSMKTGVRKVGRPSDLYSGKSKTKQK